MARFNPTSLKQPKLNQFMAFICYIISCAFVLFFASTLWVVLVKISRLYYYLPTFIYVFIFISTPLVTLFYCALFFQAACYNAESSEQTPLVPFINRPYKPTKKRAVKCLLEYLGWSYLLLFGFYVTLALKNGLGDGFRISKQMAPAVSLEFYKHDLIYIITQHLYDIYEMVEFIFLIKLLYSLPIFFFFYIFAFIAGFIREAFYPLIKTFQHDIWRVEV